MAVLRCCRLCWAGSTSQHLWTREPTQCCNQERPLTFVLPWFGVNSQAAGAGDGWIGDILDCDREGALGSEVGQVGGRVSHSCDANGEAGASGW